MYYVVVAIVFGIGGFVGGTFFSKQIHLAITNLEYTIEKRLKAIEAAVLKKL